MEFPVNYFFLFKWRMIHINGISIGFDEFRLPLKAEGHEVLYLAQTSINQIIFGAKGSVWIVFEHADEMGDHCRRILNYPTFNMVRLIQ